MIIIKLLINKKSYKIKKKNSIKIIYKMNKIIKKISMKIKKYKIKIQKKKMKVKKKFNNKYKIKNKINYEIKMIIIFVFNNNELI